MVLVGGLVTAPAMAIAGWRDEARGAAPPLVLDAAAVALPGYIVMRIGAEWVYSKEHPDNLPTTRPGSASATSPPTAAGCCS